MFVTPIKRSIAEMGKLSRMDQERASSSQQFLRTRVTPLHMFRAPQYFPVLPILGIIHYSRVLDGEPGQSKESM